MLTVAKSTMTGSEVEYTIPAGTKQIFFRPPAANFTIATESSGDTWTVEASEIYLHTFPVKESQTLYLTGTNGQVVEIMLSDVCI